MYADGTSPVNCVFTVSIRGAFSPERLRHALHKVQAKHLLLRSRIEWKRGRPYFVEDAGIPEIPVRVVERQSGIDWQVVTEVEWDAAFDVARGPLVRMVWVKGEARGSGKGEEEASELMLICPHCVCDGTTGVLLMREILLCMDRADVEIGSYPVFRSVKEIIPEGIRGGLGPWLKSLLMRLVFSLKSIRNDVVHGEAYAVRWRMEEEMSGTLLERCKEADVTVHAALCVALLQAYRAVKGEGAKNKVICPVDIRRYVREIRKDMMFAFAPIVELGLGSVSAAGSGSAAGADTGDFWERCRLLKGDLAEKVANVKAYELLLHSEYYHPIARKLVRWLCTDPGSHDLTFSNMGRVDIPEEYANFSVREVYTPTVAFPWRNSTTVVVSSFRGQIDFAFASSTGFLPRVEAMLIRDKAMSILRGAMPVLTPLMRPDALAVDPE